MALSHGSMILVCCLLLAHASKECQAPGCEAEESLDVLFLQRSRFVANEICAEMQSLDDELYQTLAASNPGLLPDLLTSELKRGNPFPRETREFPENPIGLPNSVSPVDADPPLAHPLGSTEPCAQVKPMVNVEVNNSNPIRAMYITPGKESGCGCDAAAETIPHYGVSGPLQGCWDQVVLNFAASQVGRQYDRYGAVWLHGVELLRTTTPEPNEEGITWYIEKDVTEYEILFRKPGEVVLNIPNTVTETYTGIPLVNISFSFYCSNSTSPKDKSGHDGVTVLHLRNATDAETPISDLKVQGPEPQVNVLPPVLGRDGPLGAATHAQLKVYASGHQCEEFWWINAQAGSCSGGCYREILVYVDGLLAGAALPFPVIYTGGINPYLWRPLTGIRSFDIPAYDFDLTPFLFDLTDGKEHNITLQVYHNDVNEGRWFLDPILIVHHQSTSVIESGGVAVTGDSLPTVFESTHSMSTDLLSYEQNARGSHEYTVEGFLKFSTGEVIKSSTSGQLHAESKINVCHGLAGWVDSKQVSKRITERGTARIEATDVYPLHVFWAYRISPEIYSIHASADYARDMTLQYSRRRYNLKLRNHHMSSAIYDSALMTTDWPPVDTNLAAQNYSIEVNGERCWTKMQKARKGLLEADEDLGNCQWAEGLYVCGGSVCGVHRGPVFSERNSASGHFSLLFLPLLLIGILLVFVQVFQI